MSDLGEWFRSVPIFTRYWFAGSILFTLLGRFGFINPYNLILLYEPLKSFQLWRLVTSVLYYPIQQAGFHYLINLYFLYNYSRRLEEGQYASKPSDYLFLLIFNWTCCVILGLVAELPVDAICNLNSPEIQRCGSNKVHSHFMKGDQEDVFPGCINYGNC